MHGCLLEEFIVYIRFEGSVFENMEHKNNELPLQPSRYFWCRLIVLVYLAQLLEHKRDVSLQSLSDRGEKHNRLVLWGSAKLKTVYGTTS